MSEYQFKTEKQRQKFEQCKAHLQRNPQVAKKTLILAYGASSMLLKEWEEAGLLKFDNEAIKARIKSMRPMGHNGSQAPCT